MKVTHGSTITWKYKQESMSEIMQCRAPRGQRDGAVGKRFKVGAKKAQ